MVGRIPRVIMKAFCFALFLTTAVQASAGDKPMAAVYSQNGSITASGEAFSAAKLTAAHRTLPFGTMVRVTNVRNGRTVVVRINDRGPFTKGLIIDLTPAAAQQLQFSGVTPVTLDVVEPEFTPADNAWIDVCMDQLKRDNPDKIIVRKYCVCMHTFFEDNKKVSQSDMEHKFPPAHRMCNKQAGWRYRLN